MKVMIAGGTGLVGTALVKSFTLAGHEVHSISSNQVDFRNKSKTAELINLLKPNLIIDAAAKVGGIQANSNFPYDFINQNLQIQCNLMESAVEAKIEKFVFLGSSCIYPRKAAQPIKEEYLMTGKLEETNSAYAVAKIAGIEFVNSVRKQFGYSWFSVMPTNVYGPFDNFNLLTAHVVPSLLRKILEAKERNSDIEVWGDGSAMREFIFSDDLAQAIQFCVDIDIQYEIINIGTGVEYTISELVEKINGLLKFNGEIKWDKTKPNGTPRKLLDSSRIRNLGWEPKTNLENGLSATLEWLMKTRENGLLRS